MKQYYEDPRLELIAVEEVITASGTTPVTTPETIKIPLH